MLRAIDLKQAIQATARSLDGATVLDQGSGIPNAMAAYRWLLAAHQAGVYHIQALADGGNTSLGSAAYRRRGLTSPGDTIQRFVVTSVGGQPAARLLLQSDAPWISTPRVIEPGGGPVTVALTYDAAQLRDPGLYVGTVWARPASDTLAGPSFGLTNTVVVPHSLDAPLAVRGLLTPGAVARYFLAVPEGSGGLSLTLSLPRWGDEATLFLFEPSGQPFRGGSSRAAGGQQPRSVDLSVAGNDVVPGVYEAVVAAPPLEAVKYELTAALPEVSVASVGTGPSASFRCTVEEPVVARLSADVIGVAYRERLTGSGAAPRVVETRVPPWATEMIVDVELPGALWHQLTDFGVTVFDSAGLRLSDGPLDYRFGRLSLPLDSTQLGALLLVELYPAFAYTLPAETWRAEVQVTYIGRERVPLPPLGYGADATVELRPGSGLGLQFAPVPVEVEVPAGYVPFVEVTAAPAKGPAATRRGAVER
jgi:hypothetical protein